MNTETPEEEEKDELTGGQIAGIVLMALGGLGLLVVIIMFIVSKTSTKKKKKKKKKKVSFMRFQDFIRR